MSGLPFISPPLSQSCFLKKNGTIRRNMGNRLCVRSLVAPATKTVQVSDKKNVDKSVRIGVLGASGYTGSEGNLIKHSNIIIDAKSGVSGAGRGAKEANLYTEVAEGIHAYGVTRHRHVPEIEQGLSDVVHSRLTISFHT